MAADAVENEPRIGHRAVLGVHIHATRRHADPASEHPHAMQQPPLEQALIPGVTLKPGQSLNDADLPGIVIQAGNRSLGEVDSEFEWRIGYDVGVGTPVGQKIPDLTEPAVNDVCASRRIVSSFPQGSGNVSAATRWIMYRTSECLVPEQRTYRCRLLDVPLVVSPVHSLIREDCP
jgi:hypothetical protein